MINPIKAAEAEYLLNAKPPEAIGLSRKSPTTAPSGRVRINAAQKRIALDIFVQKLRATTIRSKTENIYLYKSGR